MNAQLIPHKLFMVQSITKSNLVYKNFKARAHESPLSLLIWFKVVIESRHFEPIGLSEVTQIGDFITLQTIGISGQIKEK